LARYPNWSICQLLQGWNSKSALAQPIIIDKSCHNGCMWGHVFKICIIFCNDEIKYLPWHVIPIEVYVSFYKGEIINQPWHNPISLISLIIMTGCMWGHVFEICVSFCSGEIKYLPCQVIPIEVSVNFYKGEIINQPWHNPISLTSLVIMTRCH